MFSRKTQHPHEPSLLIQQIMAESHCPSFGEFVWSTCGGIVATIVGLLLLGWLFS